MEIKNKYKDQVWDLLQRSYADIGGIKGTGFESAQSMVQNIPMWKLGVRDGQVRAAILYKDSAGRKSVAAGTDGSADGAAFIDQMFQAEVGRSCSEKSKGALGKLMKLVPWSALENQLINISEVARIRPDVQVTPITDVDPADWPADARLTLSKYPQLKPYGYLRDIAGKPTFKVASGVTGLGIEAR